MYEGKTLENIKEEILSSIDLDLAKNEGSILNAWSSGVSLALASVYTVLDEILNNAFIKDAGKEVIDKRLAEFGFTRKEGEKATGEILIKGINNTKVEFGTQIISKNGLIYEVINQGIIDGENGLKTVISSLGFGEKYNIKGVGDSFTLVNPTDNITEIINVTEITGGIDEESDEDLKARFFYTQKQRGTSGNVSDYESWALEVEGVKNVKVIPLWNGNGTVKVIIMGDNNKNVDITILEKARLLIESKRPIGASVTVATPVVYNVDLSATVELDKEADIENIKETFKTQLEEYLIKSVKEITYTKVAGILSKLDGIVDFENLKINGNTKNIKLNNDQVGSVGTINLIKGSVD